MSIEAMRQALEVLEQINQLSVGENAIALPGEIDAAMDNLRAAIEQGDQYRRNNPLGGPAKVFDAMADAIRAGDDYHATLRSFGFVERTKGYDQTSLELCEECGWRAMIPGDGCLVCARQKAKREWVELTDDEARALVNRATFGDKTNWQALVYMVDAKLKEKNHAG
jgi:hypothetical protein